MYIIPKFLTDAAIAADEATEQELTDDQKKNFEFWVSAGCGILLFSAVIGVWVWEVMNNGGF